MTRVIAPNTDLARSLFIWDKSLLDTEAEADALVTFCDNNNVNCALIAIYPWIGSSNWSVANIEMLQYAIEALKAKGISVQALTGNHDFPVNQKWVKANILAPIKAFNEIFPSARFDAVLYDIEYWVQGLSYDLSTYIPAYCKLIESSRQFLQSHVGAFVAWWSMADGQDVVEYAGLRDTHGAHLLKWLDQVFIGSYSNIAETIPGQTGQIDMVSPWVLKSKDLYRCKKMVWVGTETKNITPATQTYYGKTKVQMETEMTLISNEFHEASGSPYVGIAVHDYVSYRVMS